MAATNESNDCSPSTTWAWRKVKIAPAPKAPREQRPKGPSKPLASVWNGRETLTISVRYRGGAECWYELKSRGQTVRIPGHVALHDVMGRIYGQHAR